MLGGPDGDLGGTSKAYRVYSGIPDGTRFLELSYDALIVDDWADEDFVEVFVNDRLVDTIRRTDSDAMSTDSM